MRKSAILTAIVILCAFTLGSMALQNGYDQFQKALAKERGEGNLEEAIALYQKVIDETKDESLAAKAQLRIGICYEKLGRQEAEKAYQKVIEKYPTQTDTVEEAREKLRLLLSAQPAVPQIGTGLNIRSVLKDKVMDWPRISPDGKFLAHFSYKSGAVAIYDLATEKDQVLNTRLERNEPGGESWSFRWSPAGNSIVCSWWEGLDLQWAGLRILYLDGARPRKLVGGGYGEIYVHDWSSDGSWILAERLLSEPSRASQIVTISVSDGSIKVIKELGPRSPGTMCFSPDGRFIVYDYSSEPSSPSNIFVLAADGSGEIPFSEDPTNKKVLDWTPDGQYILHASDRAGNWGAWLVPVHEGKALGEPKLVKQDIGSVTPLGFTNDGTFYYSTSGWNHDIYVQSVDLDGGKLQGPAELAVQRFVGSNHNADWSSDGDHLAYISRRSPSVSSAESYVLCIRDSKSGQERELFPKLDWYQWLKWTPDGRFLITIGHDGSTRDWFLIDAHTGAISPVSLNVLSPTVEWSRDGSSIYFARNDWKSQTSEIVLRNLETKQERQIFPLSGKNMYFQGLSLSPDGSKFAARIWDENRRLSLLAEMPVEGGEIRILEELQGEGLAAVIGGLAWSPDSRKILYVRQSVQERANEKRLELWFYSASSEESRKLGYMMSRTSCISLHPDGQRLAFTASIPRSAIWVMENFLPGSTDEDKGGKR